MIVRLLIMAGLVLASPALAQQGAAPIAARDGKPFKHQHSGFAFPPELIGLTRARGLEVVAPQLDVYFGYQAPDGSEEISVFVYRMTAGSLPLWFDVARDVVEQRKETGTKTAWGTPTAFTPPGQANPSALRLGWTITNHRLRSSTLTVIPMGEWLVKIRHSSETQEVASLQRRTEAAIAALGWPKAIAPAPAATPIADCNGPLALSGAAQPVADKGPGALLEAVLAQMAGRKSGRKRTKGNPETPTRWCVDRTTQSPVGLYRPVGSDDRYLMALSDSGVSFWARPSTANLLLGDKEKPGWAVSVVTAGETYNFTARDRLPLPGQVDAILKEPTASSARTWGKEQRININTDALN